MKNYSIPLRLIILVALQFVQLATIFSTDSTVNARDYSQYIQVLSTESVEPNNNFTTKDLTFIKPSTVAIPVPFFSQAPTGNWDDPFQEACEEMSVLLVQAYLQSIEWTVDSIADEVETFTAWVEQNGYGESVTIEELAIIAKQYANLNSQVIHNPDEQILEYLIDAGYPVIVPAAGRKLKNPYFTGDGPWYHMLLITGYNETHFITQEVGTQFGANYQYEKTHLLDSIHNWTGIPEEIEYGQKTVLVLSN